MKINLNTSDEEIVNYIRLHNKEFFSYIIDRYENKILSYIKRLTNNSLEAEDLVQQTFVNTYVSLNNFDNSRKFSSWIYRIAHNLTINWLKKKKASISIDENEILAESLQNKIDIEKEFVEKEGLAHLIKVINKLPDKYKEPLILKLIEEKDYSEISYILKKPKNTVGTLINRAKKILKKELSKEYET